MRVETLQSEAAECRRLAAANYEGKPEAAFLLRVASVFEELAHQRSSASYKRCIAQTGVPTAAFR